MNSTAPVFVETTHGEVALFCEDRSADGCRRWSVSRPIAAGWEQIGVVDQAPEGYRAWIDHALRPVGSVLDAVDQIVKRAAVLGIMNELVLRAAVVDALDHLSKLAGEVDDAPSLASRLRVAPGQVSPTA